jgi:hypothetical protein
VSQSVEKLRRKRLWFACAKVNNKTSDLAITRNIFWQRRLEKNVKNGREAGGQYRDRGPTERTLAQLLLRDSTCYSFTDSQRPSFLNSRIMKLKQCPV